MSEHKWTRLAKNGYLTLAGLMILLGLALLVWPGWSAALLCRLCGWLLVAFGLVKAASYWAQDLYQLAFQHDLAAGVLLLVLGLAVVLCPERMAQMIFVLLGLCILADALLKIQISIDAKRFGLPQWTGILTAALLTGVVGLVLIFRPDRSVRAAMMVLGLALVIEGGLNLITVLTAVKIRSAQ